MKILALDTATEACAVALAIDDDVLERTVLGRQHAERILELIDEILAEAQMPPTALDAIAFGRGPGMFTGLRIGAGITQGIAFAADLPVVPVSTLRVLAQGQSSDRILAALDARMGQVYWGCFVRDSDGNMQSFNEERVQSPQDLQLTESHWVGVGSGWDQYHSILMQALTPNIEDWVPQVFPSARELAHLGALGLTKGEAVAAEKAMPVYIRNDIANKPIPV